MITGRLYRTSTVFLILFFLSVTSLTCLGEIEEHEIKYDDGNFERGFRWAPPPLRGYMLAVKFTPPEVPSKLMKTSFFIYSNPNRFIVRVFDDTKKSLLEISAWPTQEGWYTVDLSGFNIIINGDFYIALEDDPLAPVSPWLGGDTSNPDGRSYWVSVEKGWRSVAEVANEEGDPDYNADFGIRVILAPIDSIVIDLDPRMNSVIIDNATYNADKLPITLNYLRGSIHMVKIGQEVIRVSDNTRFVFAGWNDGSKETTRSLTVLKGLRLVGFWKKQFLLTIISEHSSPLGGGWYEEGSSASISLLNTEVSGSHAGERFVFTGWSGDIQSTNPSVSIKMDSPKTVHANWKTQYYLDVESVYGNLRGEGWYDVGEIAYFEVDDIVDHGNGTRRVFSSWSGDARTIDQKGSVVMDSPKKVTANWKKQYYVKVSSQLPRFTGGNYWYDEGSTVTIRLEKPVLGFIVQDVFDHFEGYGPRDRVIGNGVLEVYVDSPKEIRIVWRKDYTQLIALLIALFILIVGVMLIVKRKRISVVEKARGKEGTELITGREEHLKKLQEELVKNKLYLARLEEEKDKGTISDQAYNTLKAQYESEIRQIIDEIEREKARKLEY